MSKRQLTVAMLIVLAAAAVPLVVPMSVMADAANPVGPATGTRTVHADGTVTVVLNGTWTWSGQKCTNRYGLGWAVDWWGTGTSKTPDPSFALTNATTVVGTGPAGHPWKSTATTTGTVTYAGSIQIGKSMPASYFHVGAAYAGEARDLCANVSADGTMTGSWSASATYPDAASVPTTLCVNLYDEHGKAGKSSGNAKDFSPLQDHDNSIETNEYDPAIGGNCTDTSTLTPVDEGGGL